MKKVSYCSVCYGRLWQLAFTLKENLETLKDDEELILVDYNSPDDTMLFVLGTKYFAKYINQGKFKFIKVLDVNEYNCPKSKNIAHRFGEGNILVNLDADNYITNMRDKIDLIFDQNKNSILHMETKMGDGSFGRIALTKDNFYKLGGYDENLFQHSYQDSDILKRAKGLGLEYKLEPIYTYVVANNLYAKNRYLKEDWFILNKKNIKISKKNIKEGNFVANKNKGWGKCKVIINGLDKVLDFNSIFPN